MIHKDIYILKRLADIGDTKELGRLKEEVSKLYQLIFDEENQLGKHFSKLLSIDKKIGLKLLNNLKVNANPLVKKKE